MIPDIRGSIGPAAQAPVRIRLQKVADEFPRVEWDALGALIMADCNLPIHLIGVVIVERRVTCEHLEKEDTQRPDI